MPHKLDLTGEIADAVNSAASRGRSLALAYVDESGDAALSYRGSTQVFSPTQLAIWARKQNDGFARAIANHPRVSLLYYSTDGPGPRFLSFVGTARVDPSASDHVYAHMFEAEQGYDAERKGVAVVVDIESARGFGADGPFEMTADAG